MAVLDKIFKAAVDSNASDIHVIPGEPFIIRKVGKLIKLKSPVLTPDNTKQLISEILTEEQRKILSQDLQLDFAIEVEGLGRFRGSAMQHNRGLSAVFRVIPPRI